jgi:hypothetical protein
MAPHPDDDLSIAGDCRLFRRITRHHMRAEGDHVRITSAAVDLSSDGSGTSVHLEDEMQAREITPAQLIAGYGEEAWLASLPAQAARDEDLWVIRKPVDDDPTHGEICGPRTTGKKRRLLRRMSWEIEPDNAIAPADWGR